MSTKINVRGRTVSRPGVYSQIKSGIKNPPVNLSFGNVCIIDTGGGAGFSGGAGILGENASGLDAIYVFKDIPTMRDFVKGGLHWLVAQPLFRPAGPGIQGVSTVYYIKAAVTTKATIIYELTGGGANGGNVEIDTLDEGIGSNGSVVNTVLTRGYAAKLITNPLDNTTFIMQFWRGTYRGSDGSGNNYNVTAEADTKPELIVESDPFNTVEQLYNWMERNYIFNQFFKLRVKTTSGSGAVTGADVITYAGYNNASGGTENYTGAATDAVIQAITNLDNTFFLCDDYGVANGASADNIKILEAAIAAKYEKFLIIGGGKDKTEFIQTNNSSAALAKTFNSSRVMVVHGDALKAVTGLVGFRRYNTFYKAANVLGRMCGLSPQTPVTFKDIDIDGEVHALNETEQEQALDAGILATFKDTDFNRFIVLQGINTLQDNDFLVNEGTETAESHDMTIMRIVSQTNKELMFFLKMKFFSNRTEGPNRNTVSAEDLTTNTDGFLSTLHAKPEEDNLLITHRDIVSSLTQDVAEVRYALVANGPINKIISTGILLDK